MSNINSITVIGNLTAEPELRFTNGGDPVCNFRIAANKRYTKNGETHERTEFISCVVWNGQAENTGASLHKGNRVIVQGELRQRSYEIGEGDQKQERFVAEIVCEQVAVTLQWQVVEGITRSTSKELVSTGANAPVSEAEYVDTEGVF